jgi:phosphoglycerate dehydrogenase-like enzyme
MTLVWLPDDEWSAFLDAPSNVDVEVWVPGRPIPASVGSVDFYVPEYMGSEESLSVMSQMTGLRVVQTLTAGTDDLLPYLPENATLCNAAGVHDASTAELAVGLAIAALRGFAPFIRAQTQGTWLHSRRDALADRRVMVIGAGSVGKAVIDRLSPFEVDVIAVARNARNSDHGVDVHGVDEINDLLPSADVVILTVPLTEQTMHLVDAEFLKRMRDDALLVNVARGQVVDTDALLAELRSGRMRAALDVTDPEPLPTDHPLWQAPNVLITPHVGGDTSAFLPRAWRLLQAQIDRFAQGDRLVNVVHEPSR